MKAVKDQDIYHGYVRYGYTMGEIVDHLGVHYATVSRAIKRAEGERKLNV